MNNNSISWLDNKVFNTPSCRKGTGRVSGKGANASNAGHRIFAGKDNMDADEMMMRQGMPQGMTQGMIRGMPQEVTQMGTTPMGMAQGMTQQGPPTITQPYYIPNYLARNIGKNVKAEFVLGTSQFMDKSGILREVGVNYFVLEDYISRALIMCDLYSVKFVTTL